MLKNHQLNIIKIMQEKTRQRYQSLSKEEKEKSDNKVMSDTKAWIHQKMKNKSLLSIEKTKIK